MNNSNSVGDKILSGSLTTGGVSFTFWIDQFEHGAKIMITVIYLIIAIYSLYKQVLSPLYKSYKEKKRMKEGKTNGKKRESDSTRR